MEPAEQPDSQLADSDAHSEGTGGDAVAGEKVKGVASDSGDELDTALAAAAASRKRGLSSRISDLKVEKAALKKQRQQILKDLRNAERRRRRLKKKAKELPNDDLMEVLAMRQEERRAPKRASSQSQDASAAADGEACAPHDNDPASFWLSSSAAASPIRACLPLLLHRHQILSTQPSPHLQSNPLLLVLLRPLLVSHRQAREEAALECGPSLSPAWHRAAACMYNAC